VKIGQKKYILQKNKYNFFKMCDIKITNLE
jgi:hypothetical protein